MRRGLLLITFVSFLFPAYAQEKCGTVILEKMKQTLNPRKETDAQFEQWMRDKIVERSGKQSKQGRAAVTSYVIPVVVHVIHDAGELVGGIGSSNISNAQVFSQLNVLNNDFKRLNTDQINTPAVFLSAAGSIDIEFVMAKQDPQGQPTNGITRTVGNKTSYAFGDESFKTVSYWPSENYLNVWVVEFSGNLIGFAQFPESNLPGLDPSSSNPLTDGIAVHFLAFGSNDYGPFNLDPSYTKGRTATHEVGHFLGLRHIWGDGNCANDYVDDTPAQSTNSSGCPTHPTASGCSAPAKMFQNYMDYTRDQCMNLFTVQQVGRMHVVLQQSIRRLSLTSSQGAVDPVGQVNNIALVGIDEPGLVHCEDNPTFKFRVGNSSSYPVNSFQLQKTRNGIIANQVFQNIEILPGQEKSFQTTGISLGPGNNEITFTVTNLTVYSESTPEDNTVTINSYLNTSAEVSPFRMTFEGSPEIAWVPAINTGTQNWTSASTNNGNSTVYEAFTNPIQGEESWLASPVIDLSSYPKNSLQFEYSYAYRNGKNDRLRLVASEDCGLSYPHVLYDESGSELSTVQTSLEWTPTSDADWQKKYISLNSLSGKTNIRLAFIFNNQNGNNLYIDNMEVFADDDPDPPVTTLPYQIYFSDKGNGYNGAITFGLTEKADVRLQILSMTGQPQADMILEGMLNQTYYLDMAGFSSGLYIFRIQIEDTITTSKVFLSR